MKKGAAWRIKPAVYGKWPEFPLEARAIPLGKAGFNAPPLGPSHLSDFKQHVREFANKKLFAKMTGEERRELERHQGKWPDYPLRFLHYARKYDLSVPGVTLPGSPKKWETTYNLRPRP